MIDAWSDLDSIRSVLVAVLTFGQVPPEGMEKYMNLLKRNRRYDLSTLTLPAHNPFKNMSRNTDYVLLNFSDNPRVYESSWDSVFLHRKVLAVIGLIHCPSNPDLDVVHQEFVSAMKKFSNAFVKQCLAFDPLDSQQDLMERQYLVMVPNADTKHLQFYMNTLVMDVVERLLCGMMEAARALSSSQELPYISFDKPIGQDAAKKKRFLPGRISKVTADYSLLCGILSDAKELYLASIDTTKSAGDLVWRGAALEGLACCDPNASYEDRITIVEKAIRNYERRPDTDSLRIEAFLKLARFAAFHSHPVDSLDYLSRAFELCVFVPINDRISVIVESAIIAQSLGAKRKFGMLTREAALLHAQKERWHESFSLLLLCSSVYGVNVLSSSRSWESLQIEILSELITSARATDRLDLTCSYMTQLLTRIRSSIQQKVILSDLWKTVPLVPRTQTIVMSEIPLITDVVFSQLDEHRVPKSRNTEQDDPLEDEPNEDDNVFLFRPSSTSQVVHSEFTITFDLAVGQLFYLDVTVRNPLLIELPISCVSADCFGVSHDSYPSSLSLKPLEERRIRLAILPLSVGTLGLTNIMIRAFGVETRHPVNRFWKTPISFRVCTPVPLIKAEVEDEYRGYFGQALSIPVTLRNAGDVASNDIKVRFENSDLANSTIMKLENISELFLPPGHTVKIFVIIVSLFEKIDSCRIKVTYAAEKHSEMYRELTLHIPVIVESGLSIRSFEVRPYAQCQFTDEDSSEELLSVASLEPEDCVVVCEIVNTSESRFSVSAPCHKRLKYEAEGNATHRMIFPFRRRSFGTETDECISQLVCNPETAHASTCSLDEFVQCRHHLIEMLVFKWKKSSGDFAEGEIKIRESLITPWHLRYVVPDPFFFQFELDGVLDCDRASNSPTATSVSTPVSPVFQSPNSRKDSNFFMNSGHHKSFPRGQFVSIRVIVSLRRATPMSMSVSVRPSYQDSSGQFDYDLTHRLLWTGSWDHDLGIVEPNSSTHLDLNVCFIALGKFMFELICRCEQPGALPVVFSCSLPLLISTIDKTDSDGSIQLPTE